MPRMEIRVHQGAKPEGFAVAQADEVGDRGDVVLLADPNDAAQEKKPGKGGQRRPDIDHQEVQAGGGSLADAAVKGPRRAIDSDGQGVDVGVIDDAPAGFLAAMGMPGDQEDQCGVEG